MSLQRILIAHLRATSHFDTSVKMSTVPPYAPDAAPTRGHQAWTYIDLIVPHTNVHVKSAHRLFKNVWIVHRTMSLNHLVPPQDLPRWPLNPQLSPQVRCSLLPKLEVQKLQTYRVTLQM